MNKQNKEPEILHVLVMTPEQTLFEGKAVSVTCTSPKGVFDVLPEHSFFMSIINTQIDIRTQDHNKKTIHINQAILQVSHDQVVILIDVQQKEAQSLIHSLLRPDEIMHPDNKNNKPVDIK